MSTTSAWCGVEGTTGLKDELIKGWTGIRDNGDWTDDLRFIKQDIEGEEEEKLKVTRETAHVDHLSNISKLVLSEMHHTVLTY